MGAVVVAAGLATASVATAKPKRDPCPKHAQTPKASATTTTTIPCVARAREPKRDGSGTWKGSFVASSAATVPGNSCTSAWKGSFSLIVRDNGSLVGNGDAT